ncbi:MAG: radical SAM protein [Sphaerochaetaceae bacterium]
MNKRDAMHSTIMTMMKVIKKNPDGIIERILPMVEYFMGNETHKKQLNNFRTSWNRRDNNYKLVHNIIDTIDPNCLDKMVDNLVLNAAWEGNQKLRDNRDKYDLNIPWAILIDPTTACNLHCKGCWAEGYGRTDSLDNELIDRIITEGKELGIYMYLYSGGEPLVRRKDLIELARKHNDCYFLAFTNGTLIDEEFAEQLREVGNFTLAISMEGSREETDARRGEGSYDTMMHAMKMLRKKGVPFGFSSCYHSENSETVGSEEYIDSMIDLGAIFGWLFTYIPVGKNAVPSLIATPEQREYMYHQVRTFRKTKPIFLMDFWNDGEYVYGCIAGGRNYFHINARGDVEPCAFIHYSDISIKDHSLLEVLHSQLFQQYRAHQPFNKNYLRPCPLLDNPQYLRKMVNESKAVSTEYIHTESVEDLTAKTDDAAAAWAPVADRLWRENPRSVEMEHKSWPGAPDPGRKRRRKSS